MDIYFLVGIGCFVAFGLWYEESRKKKWLSALIYALSVATVVSAFLLYVRSVEVYYPEKVNEFASILGIR
jgi:hypothetical protein